MGRDRQAVLIAAAIMMLGAGLAAAQPKRQRAVAHFEQGEAYFAAEAYDKAIEEYQAAYALVAKPGLLFNIALSYEHLGDGAQAIAYYQRYLDDDPAGAKVAEARARIEGLTRAARVAEEAAERTGEVARHRADAAKLAAGGDHQGALAELAAAEALSDDPDIVFELAEAHRAAGDPVAALAEYRRYLELPGARTHRAAAARSIEELDRPAEEIVVRDPRPSLLPAWIAFGGAALIGGVGLYVQRDVWRLRGELDDELGAGTPPLDSRDPRFDDGERADLRAKICFGVAGAAALTGAILLGRALLTERGERRVIIQPAAGPDGASLHLEASW